jgi:hypothetical protein
MPNKSNALSTNPAEEFCDSKNDLEHNPLPKKIPTVFAQFQNNGFLTGILGKKVKLELVERAQTFVYNW